MIELGCPYEKVKETYTRFPHNKTSSSNQNINKIINISIYTIFFDKLIQELNYFWLLTTSSKLQQLWSIFF